MSPKLNLCADDFGLSRAVDGAIIDLVVMGRLNAVSCMSVGKCFEKDAERLINAKQAATQKVEIGLHLTLTEYEPLADMPRFAPGGVFSSVTSVLIRTHIGLLNRQEVRCELERQWQKFVDVMGHEPDFVDGHQHVHLFPFIREMVVDIAKRRFSHNQWVRLCDGGGWRWQSVKDPIILAMSKLLRLKVNIARLTGNAVFLGINTFDPKQDFGDLMRGWLTHAKHANEWTVIMCHPGHESGDEKVHDPISKRRVDEFDYLSGDDFAQDLIDTGFACQFATGPKSTQSGGGISSGTKKSGAN